MEEDSCRICLSNTQLTERRDLYSEDQNTLSVVGQLYQEVLNISISVEEIMLRYICNSCDLQLKLFKQLKTKALETHTLLTEILSAKNEYLVENEGNTPMTEYLKYHDHDIEQSEDDDDNKTQTEDEILEQIEKVDNYPIPDYFECQVNEDIENEITEVEPKTEVEVFENLMSVEELTKDNNEFDFDTSDEEEYVVAYLDEEEPSESIEKETFQTNCDEESLIDEHDIIGNNLNSNITKIPSSNERCEVFCCPHCSQTFELKSQLKSHKKKMHCTTTKIQCHLCEKIMMSEETYQAHMNIHNGLPAYQCEMCDKAFNQRVHYNYHILGHKNERNIICDVCQKGFISKSDLKTHMRCHTDERRYKCDICEKTFRAHTHMINHRYSHFEKQFECTECFQKYVSPNTLRTHFRAVHMAEVPFECKFCEKRFKRKHHLKAHYKTHSKDMGAFTILEENDFCNVDVE